MNLLKTGLLAMVFLVVATSCSKDEEVLTQEEVNYSFDVDVNLAEKTDWVFANEILDLINQHRQDLGLVPLKADQRYASAYSVQHTQYMIEVGRISHDNFSRRSNGMRERGARGVAENVAYGYETAEAVVHAWLNSTTHRNAIEGNYSHTGFGVIADERGVYYFTQLFYLK